jgi:SAM-dependent methyltransferase
MRPSNLERRASWPADTPRIGAVDLHALATRELPRPLARVLEVGCGRGELARKLAADGYEVLAIDPRAPEGPIFRRTTLEALRDERRRVRKLVLPLRPRQSG